MEFPSLLRKSQKFVKLGSLWSGDLFVGSDVATEKEMLTLLFPYFMGLNQIEMSERACDRHCHLLSLVNFGAFTTKRPQRKQVKGEGEEGNNLLASIYYVHTSRQLEASFRSQCRRCLRILAIFRPAAPDEATCPFIFFFFSYIVCCYLTSSPEKRKVATVGNTAITRE